MDTDSSNFFSEIEKIMNTFKSELQEKTKSYIEHQNKIFERPDDDQMMNEELDNYAMPFLQNQDLLSQVFEQLKESFDNKIQEKSGRVLKDRKDHWEHIEREIND